MSSENRGTACECIIHEPEAHEDADGECLHEDPNTGLQCSRPDGHDGVHAGCNHTEHPAMAWPNKEDSE